MEGAPEIWRGGVNTWECDEMGHMNVRFYVARAMEGLAGLARLLGMSDAFTTHATATLVVQEHHIRFLREARAGAPLHMTGGVVEMDETSATLLQVLTHAGTGEPAASFVTKVVHTGPVLIRPFPWPERAKRAAEGLMVQVPTYAGPRSVAAGLGSPSICLARANELGLQTAGRGAVRPGDCDVFGRMDAEVFIGRISDGVPTLLSGVRAAVASAASEEVKRIGGAVLEYRFLYLAWPQVGDHLELRSGLAGIGDKTQRLVHWMLDPVSGRPWASAEAVAINLDLDTRKIVPIAPEARAALQGSIIGDLTI